MITITRQITQEETLWIPELYITWTEGNRVAQVRIPVTKWDGTLLDPLIAIFEWEDFNTFYTEYVNDKYLLDVVLAQNNIEADTSTINDITN